MLENLKSRAVALKKEVFAIYLAARDPRTPWYAKVLILFVVAHTFSPIDLIPDFIPVLGYLDDLIVTPLGLALAIRLIPPEVLAEARETAARGAWSEPSRRLALPGRGAGRSGLDHCRGVRHLSCPLPPIMTIMETPRRLT
jgi:uncharacterized membrane protein YkvA (DUF1232 family)